MKSKMEVHVIMRLGIQFLLFYMYASIWLSASFLELFSSEGGGGGWLLLQIRAVRFQKKPHSEHL